MSQLIDVLICAYNEAASLPALLDSLTAQTVGLDAFRVIFVDNASTDNTKAVVETYRDRLNIHYIFEPQPGKVFALNTGYRAAITEYVAQIDGDCKADEHWLINILRAVKEEKPDLLGGPYYPYYNSNKPAWFKDGYNTFFEGDSRKELPNSYLPGANVIWRRSIVVNSGGYNPGVSIIGYGIVGGEDTELITRARKLHPDLMVLYDPSVVVYHLTKQKSLSLLYQIKWRFLHGKSSPYIFQPRIRSYVELVAIFLMVLVRMTARMSVFWMFRDRSVYKYYQNYLIEVVGSDFSRLGRTLETLICKLNSVSLDS